MARKITIYGLTDRYGQIVYVGQTCDPKGRFSAHYIQPRKFDLAGMAILASTVSRFKAWKIEQRWIEYFGLDNLYNTYKSGMCGNRISASGKVHVDLIVPSLPNREGIMDLNQLTVLTSGMVRAVKLSNRTRKELAVGSGLHESMLSMVMRGKRKVRYGDPRFMKLGRLVGLRSRRAVFVTDKP